MSFIASPAVPRLIWYAELNERERAETLGHMKNQTLQRIDGLLAELRDVVEMGIAHGELAERMDFRFYLPSSRAVPGGIIACDFSVLPIAREDAGDQDLSALHRSRPTAP